jgi:oligopeptide transport system substrate-binding protein
MPPESLGVKAVSDTELHVDFESPCPFFPEIVTLYTFLPIRKDFYEAAPGTYGNTHLDLFFNGPFTMTQWVQGTSFCLEKNPNYWISERTRIDVIDAPFVTADDQARFNFFLSKESRYSLEHS